ncbi:MAG: hypothetical protein ACYS18_09780 [Planctomycetota bacterium]|jgi:hypothetical protein
MFTDNINQTTEQPVPLSDEEREELQRLAGIAMKMHKANLKVHRPEA